MTVAPPMGSIQSRRGADEFPYSPIHAWYANRNVTHASGTISAWASEGSGASKIFTAAGAAEPPYNLTDASFGNKPSVGPGDGVNDRMVTSATIDLSSYGGITHAITFKYGGGTGLIYDSGAIAAFGGFFIVSNNTNVVLRFLATSGAQQASFSATVGVTYRLVYVLHVNSGTTYPRLYINGVAGTPGGTSDRGFSAARTHAILARQDMASSWCTSTIGNHAIWPVELTAGEMLAVDAYMATRCT